MYKNFNLTEEERKQILEQHSAYGYRKPLNEESPMTEQSTMDMNEYSEGFMNKIVNKFKQELTSEVELYVNRFKEISKNLENRDITTYSFEQLKQTVDSYVDGYEKDSIKRLNNDINKEVERNSGVLFKNPQDYRDELTKQAAQRERPSFADRYKPLNEEKLSSLISESMVQAQMAIGDAKSKMSSGEKPDSNTMGQIKQCITQKQLTSLMFLTTGAGAYALGIVAILIAGGAVTGGSTSVVGMVAGGTLAVGSIITLFITGLSEKDGGLGADPSRDVKALLSCMGI